MESAFWPRLLRPVSLETGLRPHGLENGAGPVVPFQNGSATVLTEGMEWVLTMLGATAPTRGSDPGFAAPALACVLRPCCKHRNEGRRPSPGSGMFDPPPARIKQGAGSCPGADFLDEPVKLRNLEQGKLAAIASQIFQILAAGFEIARVNERRLDGCQLQQRSAALRRKV